MAKIIFRYFYGFPIPRAIFLMLIIPLVWTILNYLIEIKINRKYVWKIGNVMIAMGMIAVILIATLHSRGGVSELVLEPFYSLREMKSSPDLGRSMFMNIFLFFPLGLSLPYAFPEKWKHNALLTILFALTFSIVIEYLQYHYHLGRTETDDVLCNTLGAFIGTLSYTLSRKFNQK